MTARTAPYVKAEEEFAEALNFLVSQVDGEPYAERLDVLEAMERTITREADSAREFLRATAELRDWEAVGDEVQRRRYRNDFDGWARREGVDALVEERLTTLRAEVESLREIHAPAVTRIARLKRMIEIIRQLQGG